MSLKKRLLAGALSLCAITFTAEGAGFAISEQSAAAMGTGGAYSAAQAPSSIFFNPAGIANLEGIDMELGLNILIPATDFTGPTNRSDFSNISMESQTFAVPSLHLTYGLKNGHVLGFGVFSYMGLGVEWAEDWVGREVIEDISLTAITFNPTYAMKLGDNFRVGFGASLTHATVALSRDTWTGLPFNEYIDVEMEGDGIAYGYNFGLQYDMDEKTTFGLSWRSPISLPGEGDAKFSWPAVNNPTQQALLEASFPTTDMSVDINMPGILMAGVSYKHNEQFTFRGDLVYSTWSEYEELFFDFKTDAASPADSRSPKDYSNTIALRFGAEWMMNASTILRAGYYYEQEAAKDELVEPSLPDADRNGYSVGLGYALGGGNMLDFYFLMVTLNDRESTFAELPGTYESNIPILGMGWTKSF